MISLDELKDLLPYQFRSDKELANSVLELVDLFNYKREAMGEYLENRRLVSAYVLFYFTTNLPKLNALINLYPQLKSDFENSTFVDIGTGPGTFLSAYYKLFGTKKKAYGIEISKTMQQVAYDLLDEICPGHQTEFISGNYNFPKDTLLTFTNSFNEMGVEKALDYVRDYGRSKILFIEPGTKETFQKMMVMRDELIERGYDVVYPCPSNQACPWATSKDDWCHQFVQLKHDESVERLCQLVQKDRRLQSVCLFYFVKNSAAQEVNRVVRKYPFQKHAVVFDICSHKDGANQVMKFESLKRKYSKSDLKVLDEISSGEEIQISVEKELKDGTYRGEILNFRKINSDQ
jgi:SAM-dependent methyltransferase